jgi:hypothetical protein
MKENVSTFSYIVMAEPALQHSVLLNLNALAPVTEALPGLFDSLTF